MMNTKFKYTILLAGVIALMGCSKWIDYNPHDNFLITEQDYLQSESDYRTMAISVYSPLQWLNQRVVVGEIASDNAVAGGENASDVLTLQQIDDYTHTPQNSTLQELWQSAYEGINRANYMLQYKDVNLSGNTIDFAGKEALYGEVNFLRAYYYFELVRMFGDVPLFTEKRLGLADSRTLQRSPKAEVYAVIEQDLQNAIAALPAVQVEKGRITKYAAQALLGKVYLYQEKFAEAVPLFEAVINSGAFSLVDDYAAMFLASGENGPESVFEIQYTNTSPYYNWGGATRGQGNYAVQQTGIRGINGSAAMPYAPGWSTNLPTQDLASAFKDGDQRKEATILDIEAYKAAHPEYNITYQVAPYKNTGLYNQKYQPRKGETSGQLELNYLNNFRIIRYADVLLMAAEAIVQSNGDMAKARDYLNQVRERAFGDNSHNSTASGSALYEEILAERRVELGMEGDRFFDLVRTGRAAAEIEGFQTGKHEVFPIPLREIEVSELTQNPGY